MADVARGGEDDVLGSIRACVVAGEHPPRDRRDDLGASDHRASERMRPEDRLRRDVVDEVVRRVLDHRDLLEHDLALGVDVDERRPEDHVGHDVERPLEPVVGNPRVDDGRLARGGGVQLPTELVEDLGDLLRRVARRALEEQMLDEVRHAGACVGLVTRARADPEAERDRAHARDALRDDALARRELGELVLRHAAGSYRRAVGCPSHQRGASARPPKHGGRCVPGTSEAATPYMSVVPESRPESVKLSRPLAYLRADPPPPRARSVTPALGRVNPHERPHDLLVAVDALRPDNPTWSSASNDTSRAIGPTRSGRGGP